MLNAVIIRDSSFTNGRTHYSDSFCSGLLIKNSKAEHSAKTRSTSQGFWAGSCF
jgi:hypothetical protein